MSTAEMIDIIHNNRKLDPAWMFCSRIGASWQSSLATAPRVLLMIDESSDFASYYAANEARYKEDLQKLFEEFADIEH